MKVLQINSYFAYGSTGKIEKEINDNLIANGHDTYICYAWDTGFYKHKNTEFFKYSTYVERCIGALITRITGNRYGQAFFATLKLKRYIKKTKPDIVHIHCPNSYDVNLFSLLTFLKKKKLNVVITEHAEFFHTGNCPHAHECDAWISGCHKCPRLFYSTKSVLLDFSKINWKRMKKSFENFKTVVLVPVSVWLGERTKISGITKNAKIKVILNGVDTENFRFYNKNEVTENIRSCFKRKTVLFVANDFKSEQKGGKYVLQLAEELPEYDFLIISNDEFDSSNLENVKHISFIKNPKELAQYYSLADVTILTSKRETFSMVVAESLCCGTPIVAFKAGGPESIAVKEYSEFVDYGNIDMLKQVLLSYLKKDFNKKVISETAIPKYTSVNMVKNYLELYEELVNKNNINN